MSLEAMKWAIKEAPLQANAAQARNRLVLIALADRYNNDTQVAWPSIATIADDLNMSRNTVQKALDALEQAGLIERAHPHWVAHIKQQYRPTVWTLRLDCKRAQQPAEQDNGTAHALNQQVNSGQDVLASSDQDVLLSRGQDVLAARGQDVWARNQRGNQSGTQTETKAMRILDGKRVNLAQGELVEMADATPAQPSEPKKPANNYPPEFEQWYKIYPRKKAKGDALKAFKAARKNVGQDELVEKTAKFARYVEQAQMEARFVPYPATWLRAAQWEDELEAPQTPNSGAGVNAGGRKEGAMGIARRMIFEQGYGQNTAGQANANHRELNW